MCYIALSTRWADPTSAPLDVNQMSTMLYPSTVFDPQMDGRGRKRKRQHTDTFAWYDTPRVPPATSTEPTDHLWQSSGSTDHGFPCGSPRGHDPETLKVSHAVSPLKPHSVTFLANRLKQPTTTSLRAFQLQFNPRTRVAADGATPPTSLSGDYRDRPQVLRYTH